MRIKIIYSSKHKSHIPPFEIFNGNRDPHAEVPGRIENIKRSLEKLDGIQFLRPRRFPLSWIERVHDHAYISYLTEAGRSTGSTYVYPSVFPFQSGQHTNNQIGARGRYSFDLYTPVSSTTYEAAHSSVMTALTAASLVIRGERAVYALCRPPGHHAERSRMGGYCYFNNAAIATEYLSLRGSVAVLDIDVHHGNGTQHIFYARRDVLVVNIHADPNEKFPYFSGKAGETGEGVGVGYNINFPLPLRTSDRAYHLVLTAALDKIKRFAPQYLVVSVGYDTHVDDPIGGLSLTTSYYRYLAQAIANIHLPTVLLQEGGYNTSLLGKNAVSFVKGFLSTKL